VINFFLIILLFLTGAPAFADYIRVGNGGEGYLVNGVTYTRDLYDYDLHLKPWIGDYEDEVIRRQVEAWTNLNLSAQDQRILIRKLTDLNDARPYLGDDIIFVIRYFKFTLTDDTLYLIEPDEVRREINPSLRVPIANRLFSSILINRKHFESLNSENKAALIIHEAVYALMRLRLGSGNTSQSLSMTRYIVAAMFDAKTLQSKDFIDTLRKSLNVDDLPDTTYRPLLVGTYRLVLSSQQSPYFFTLDISYHSYKHSTTLPAEEACRGFFRKSSHLDQVSISPNPKREVMAQTYFDSRGVLQYAIRLRSVLRGSAKTYNFSISSESECVMKIIPVLADPPETPTGEI
jgi:hypothetical protein